LTVLVEYTVMYDSLRGVVWCSW